MSMPRESPQAVLITIKTMKKITTQHYLKVKEAAAYLNVAPTTVYKLMEERRIPFYKLPGYRLKLSDLDNYTSSCRINIIE